MLLGGHPRTGGAGAHAGMDVVVEAGPVAADVGLHARAGADREDPPEKAQGAPETADVGEWTEVAGAVLEDAPGHRQPGISLLEGDLDPRKGLVVLQPDVEV